MPPDLTIDPHALAQHGVTLRPIPRSCQKTNQNRDQARRAQVPTVWDSDSRAKLDSFVQIFEVH